MRTGTPSLYLEGIDKSWRKSFTTDADDVNATFVGGLDLDNSVNSGHLERSFLGAADVGSGGLSAVTLTPLVAGDHTAYMDFAKVTGTNSVYVTNPNLVAIGLTSVPEPATMGLLAIGGIAMLLRRRKR